MENLTALFKEKNLKLTPQRYAIYKYLKSTKSHPSAEMIYEALKPDFPTMSLATVYKTVNTLIELGLVQELNVGEDNFRFDANVENHPHIVCTKCGRVDDIEDAVFEHLNKEVENYTSYKVSTHKLYFYGVCPKCQKELQ
ncbi:Fur family transcriptional regulator [Thermobrachium celere]|uniref:Zinc uptake regulation protein ZUR n=1 Tax=Thermobrachium celere DSM 8682 TaxID=941824 RepID=R7RR48_9CLOT|nr:Fur family transcriptional regulator [Thermobrachium celere]CDF57778.1 Zinc uptake regulation protein ZUR [Thermobrachium celere DSM 8682]